MRALRRLRRLLDGDVRCCSTRCGRWSQPLLRNSHGGQRIVESLLRPVSHAWMEESHERLRRPGITLQDRRSWRPHPRRRWYRHHLRYGARYSQASSTGQRFSFRSTWPWTEPLVCSGVCEQGCRHHLRSTSAANGGRKCSPAPNAAGHRGALLFQTHPYRR